MQEIPETRTMKSSISVVNRKPAASFRIMGFIRAIAPLWLILAAPGASAHAQTSNDTFNSVSTSSSADWTQYHRDNMQRWNPYETMSGVNNVETLKLKWRYSIESETVGGSSPAVANGVVYLGGPATDLYALIASTGEKMWSYTTGAGISSSPAVVNGLVYFGSNDGNLYALNAGTGAKQWSFATGGNVYSSPTVVNGVVYFGSDDGNVYALNASTGARLWSFTTGSVVRSSPAIVNGVVYIGSFDDNLYALNASTGAKLWSYAAGDAVRSSPAVANGVVYFGSYDSNLYALNANTGAKLWSYSIGIALVISSPAVANGVVYFGGDDNLVYALDAHTGSLLWTYDAMGSTESAPAVANGVVYVANGLLFALNARTGSLLWSYDLGFFTDTSPVVVDGVIYASNWLGDVYSFALGDTADLYLRAQPSPVPVVQGDLLTYAFPVWNLGPGNASQEVLTTRVPEGTTFDYIRISGTRGLGTCTTPPYQGTGPIVCHENSSMAPNTTWTIRLTVKVTAPSGTVIRESATVIEDTSDPNTANNTSAVSTTVQ
jgi:outer membrane protein assembly factor BamB